MYNIEYSSSNEYFNYMYVSIKSVIENNRDLQICFHIFFDDLTEQNLNELRHYIESCNMIVKYYDIKQYAELIDSVYSHGFRLSYCKLVMSRIIDEDLVLHLGADTLVRSSLKSLFSIDMNDYFVAGVQDTISWHNRKKIELSRDDNYICADVTLHNLKKQREEGIYEKFAKCLIHFNGHVTYCEQGMMNYVFRNRMRILEVNYCVMPPPLYFSSVQIKKIYNLKWYYSQEELNTLYDETVIVHFTNGFYGKPWFADSNNPFKDEFLKYNEGNCAFELKKGSGISKNSQIAKKIYEKLPFFIYIFFTRLLELHRTLMNKER